MHHVGILAFIVFPALLLLWSRWRWVGSPWPAAVVTAAFGGGQVREALANIRNPREWDYACFWLYGHVARSHANLYDPNVFAKMRVPVALDGDFRQAVIAVGFPYPPPSIVLFWPLGAIDDVSRGLALWYCAQLAAFVVAALALQRAFFPREGARGMALIAALALMLPALSSNTSQAQTNVFLLALVAVAYLWRDRPAGAVFSALCIWVKPYAAALILYDVAAGRMRRLAVAGVTVAFSLGVSLALVGPLTFATYVRSNPALREPASAFTEAVNQSLLATILRTTHAALPAHVSPSSQPLYLLLAAALLGLTSVLCARYRAHTDLCFTLTLLAGLLVYPGTLDAYGTVVILPLLVLWSRRDDLPLQSAGIAALSGAVVLLQGPLHAGFLANALLYCACAGALAAVGASPGHERPGRRAILQAVDII